MTSSVIAERSYLATLAWSGCMMDDELMICNQRHPLKIEWSAAPVRDFT
jgi:hypothetical protein